MTIRQYFRANALRLGGRQDTNGDIGTLALLIEKDFACLDGSEADNEDTFPNPNDGTSC